MTFTLYELKPKFCVLCRTQYKPKSPNQKYCSRKCSNFIRNEAHKERRKALDQRDHLGDIWRGMLYRCYKEDHASYQNYGARGIFVDERWWDFENFYKDMFPKPLGTQLDRKDVLGPYSRENCRWVTRKINGLNKTNNKLVKFGDINKPVSWWARKRGMAYNTLSNRLTRGWPIEKALFTPVKSKKLVI